MGKGTVHLHAFVLGMPTSDKMEQMFWAHLFTLPVVQSYEGVSKPVLFVHATPQVVTVFNPNQAKKPSIRDGFAMDIESLGNFESTANSVLGNKEESALGRVWRAVGFGS